MTNNTRLIHTTATALLVHTGHEAHEQCLKGFIVQLVFRVLLFVVGHISPP